MVASQSCLDIKLPQAQVQLGRNEHRTQVPLKTWSLISVFDIIRSHHPLSQNQTPNSLFQNGHRDPLLLKILHLLPTCRMLSSQMFQPMILPPEPPLHPIFHLRLQCISTVVMRTEVLDCVVVHTVVMPVEIFWGREAFAALSAFRRSDMILLVST